MQIHSIPSTQHDTFVLDQEIEKLKDEIKMMMATLDRLAEERHDTDDATRHLDDLLQKYSSLVQVRYLPPAQ